MIISSSAAGPFGQPGDSGAVILDTTTLTPIGLLFGEVDPKGRMVIASPMTTISPLLNISPEGSSIAGAESTVEFLGTLDPRLDRLAAIQERHEDAVLLIPGVQGIGIGLDETGRELVFHVFVSVRTLALIAAVPQEIEGVPVRFVETGGELKLL